MRTVRGASSRGCLFFVLGAATASAVWLVLIRYVILVAVRVPVVTLNEWGTGASYEVSGARSVVLSELFGTWLPGTATFRAGAEVPLLENRGRVEFYVVPDHRAPVTFLVDTGAFANFMAWDALSQFGIPEHVPVGGSFAAPKLQAARAEVETQLFVLDRLGVGGHTLHDQVFTMVPSHRFHRRMAGLGSHAFAAVTLDIDLVDRVLRIDPTDPVPPGTPFVLDVPMASVHARFGELEVVAMLDTGATQTSISPGLRARLGLVEGAEASISDAAGVSLDARNVQLPAFELAGVTFAAQEGAVFPIVPYEAVAGALYMNVGMSSLDGHRVVIDYPNRTVAILADTAGESANSP